MRGKVITQRPTADRFGITPAYAGKSLTIQKMSTASRDHPRVCGEKVARPGQVGRQPGSPPRMRGKGASAVGAPRAAGITPAYAGKSVRLCPMCQWRRDHPRVCGEKICEGLGCRGALGSPPRMRGKGLLSKKCLLRGGITPAYAGKSVRILQLLRVDKDHPRVCGEKSAHASW